MAATTAPGIRRSITDIQNDYDNGEKTALETLIRAWKGIKELPATDARSFFILGGYHGEPFRGEGEFDPSWWGGYCQHGTVLFPSWHRVYLWRLEKALQSIPGCADVMLPFWDECSDKSRDNGIPRALTDETFVLDGQTIPNPLRSFVLPVAIVDQVQGDQRPSTASPRATRRSVIRCPGLVGTPENQAATAAHNAQLPGLCDECRLSQRQHRQLAQQQDQDRRQLGRRGVQKFIECLNAPNYTLFSNTTSASVRGTSRTWSQLVVAVESPHNSMHLAVGGFDVSGPGRFFRHPGREWRHGRERHRRP